MMYRTQKQMLKPIGPFSQSLSQGVPTQAYSRKSAGTQRKH